jgi:hypothetical protein
LDDDDGDDDGAETSRDWGASGHGGAGLDATADAQQSTTDTADAFISNGLPLGKKYSSG